MNQRLKKWVINVGSLLILLLAAILLALCVGEMNLSPTELLSILKSKSGIEYSIIVNIRIPRILLAIAVGGALSISGLVLQAIYRNPLVEPYTLGISGGAALGVALGIVFGATSIFSIFSLPIYGIIGAFITIVIMYFLSMRRTHLNINSILLTGVMISFITSSAIMFLLATTTTEKLQNIIFWTMGSLDEPNITLVYLVLTTSLLGLGVFYFFVRQLNALRLGESHAKYIGVNTSLIIKILFVVASIITGISVATVGVIGFVGLVVPHLLRYWLGNDYRILLISTFLGGAIFLILSDVFARTIISPNELPIGVITGLIGGTIFIIAISKTNKLLKF
ncbi:MAG: iron ABC transporter permease [Bacteroidales bacterium]|nr:iron ABC transporter permease [Bacteroidales bacterium]